jgi:large subunit ribosomal protein L10e
MLVHVIEGLRRCKYNFPGAQKIVVSKNWGFTQYSVEEYKKLRASGKTNPDGAYVKVVSNRGPLKVGKKASE